MLFTFKNRQKLEELEELSLFKKSLKKVRLQDKPGEQIYHQNVENLYEPMNDAI